MSVSQVSNLTCLRACGLLLLAALGVPGVAASADPASDAVAKATAEANAQAALYNAQAAAINAEAAKAKAQTDALGLTAFKGQTTLGTNAGVIEEWMLSGGTVNQAAATIAQEVKNNHAERVIVLADAETLNLGLPASLQGEMSGLGDTIAKAIPKDCTPKGGNVNAQVAPPVFPALGALLGVLRSDTDISGLSISPADRALVNAIAGQPDITWIIPSEAVSPADFDKSPLAGQWNKLRADRDAAFACRSTLANAQTPSGAKGKAAAAKLKAEVAILDDAIGKVDEFNTRAVHASKDGPSLLAQGVQLAKVGNLGGAGEKGGAPPPAAPAPQPAPAPDGKSSTAPAAKATIGTTPLVLRLKIEQAGGTLVKRSNLATTFGFNGVSVSGGLVVSYRLTDPTNGEARGGALLVCRTVLTSLSDVQKGSVGKPDCYTMPPTKNKTSP